jgi:hypothetical protein
LRGESQCKEKETSDDIICCAIKISAMDVKNRNQPFEKLSRHPSLFQKGQIQKAPVQVPILLIPLILPTSRGNSTSRRQIAARTRRTAAGMQVMRPSQQAGAVLESPKE